MAYSGAPVTLDAAMLQLSYLLGETSVPNPQPPDRVAFLQAALERCYRAWDFEFAEVTTTVTLTNGQANLPSDIALEPKMDVRVKNDRGPGSSTGNSGVGGDFIFQEIDYNEQDSFGNGDYKYWVTGSPQSYVLNTTENGNPAVTTLTIRYYQSAPIISSTQATPFPSAMVLARGALIYYRQAEDPQADVSQLEALFQNELEEIISVQIRNKPDGPAVTRQQKMGTYTGDVDVTNAGMAF